MIAICGECDYRANMEAAECVIHNQRHVVSDDLTLVHTPVLIWPVMSKVQNITILPRYRRAVSVRIAEDLRLQFHVGLRLAISSSRELSTPNP